MSEKREPIIVPIASGKGGVGKTFLSINLSFALAMLGKKTILIDLDFGGANVHMCLNYKYAPNGIGNFLNEKKSRLENYLLATSNKNLQIIPGDAEMVGIANISAMQKKKLLKQILTLDAEYIVLDLGAGSTYNTIDFFMISPFAFLVITKEITSLLNAYALLKNSIFRLLYQNLKKNPTIKEIFDNHYIKGGEEAWTIDNLLKKIGSIDSDAYQNALSILDMFKPKLVLNMGDNPSDINKGEVLRSISKKNLNVDMEYIGYIQSSEIVSDSILKCVPIALSSPNSQIFQTILRIAYKIVNAKKFPYFLLDIDDYESSLYIIEEEATDDFVDGFVKDREDGTTVQELLSTIERLESENLELKEKIRTLRFEVLKNKRS